MKIIKAWYERAAGYPLLRLKLEGFEPIATVDGEAFRHLVGRKWGAVFLGPEFVELLPIIRRGEVPLAGFTDDAAVVDLAKDFLADINSGEFKDGKVLVGADNA